LINILTAISGIVVKSQQFLSLVSMIMGLLTLVSSVLLLLAFDSFNFESWSSLWIYPAMLAMAFINLRNIKHPSTTLLLIEVTVILIFLTMAAYTEQLFNIFKEGTEDEILAIQTSLAQLVSGDVAVILDTFGLVRFEIILLGLFYALRIIILHRSKKRLTLL
jgi:isoprenylcysteine carboxyl methyltransferase (ICMT) family protein YpbQ